MLKFFLVMSPRHLTDHHRLLLLPQVYGNFCSASLLFSDIINMMTTDKSGTSINMDIFRGILFLESTTATIMSNSNKIPHDHQLDSEIFIFMSSFSYNLDASQIDLYFISIYRNPVIVWFRFQISIIYRYILIFRF